MIAKPALASLLLALSAGAAAAEDNAPEVVGKVGVTIDEQTPELGRLHLTGLAGYQLSSPAGAVVLNASGTFQLLDRVFVRGGITLGVSGDYKPLRVEAGVMLFAVSKLQVENERIDLEAKGGQITYVNVPVRNRNRGGLGVSLMTAHGGEKYESGGMKVSESTTALMAAIGINAIGSTGLVTTVEGYGKRSNYRWNAGGLEALIDLTRSYDMEPDAKGSRFGGRLWAETIWFKEIGMAARIELAKYPGFAGWLLLASLGVGVHAL
jgi:hypothetical protein